MRPSAVCAVEYNTVKIHEKCHEIKRAFILQMFLLKVPHIFFFVAMLSSFVLGSPIIDLHASNVKNSLILNNMNMNIR